LVGPDGFTSSSEDINNLFEDRTHLLLLQQAAVKIDTTVVVTGHRPYSYI